MWTGVRSGSFLNAAWLLSILATGVCSAAVTPEVFAPGVISAANHDAAPAFTPDGKTVYFQRSSVRGGTILVSHLEQLAGIRLPPS